ncbi:MAG: type II toxin-antitoxin system RelE/ParE family toxin [Brasilonema sp.]
MKTEFRKSFEKDLAKLRNINLLHKIKEIIEEIENTDRLELLTNIKKHQHKENYYRIRVEDYRIGISSKNDTVTFVRVRTSPFKVIVLGSYSGREV